MMLPIAAAIFALTALGGLLLAALHFTGKELPLPLALVHGAAGAAGLAALAWTVFKTPAGGLAAAALGLFVLAALGGFYLFSFHVRRLRLPSPVVVVHALAAVTAFGLLVAAAWRG